MRNGKRKLLHHFYSFFPSNSSLYIYLLNSLQELFFVVVHVTLFSFFSPNFFTTPKTEISCIWVVQDLSFFCWNIAPKTWFWLVKDWSFVGFFQKKILMGNCVGSPARVEATLSSTTPSGIWHFLVLLVFLLVYWADFCEWRCVWDGGGGGWGGVEKDKDCVFVYLFLFCDGWFSSLVLIVLVFGWI